MRGLLGLAALVGCTAAPVDSGTAPDTAAVDTGECGDGLPGATAQGEADCTAGICEVPEATAWLGGDPDLPGACTWTQREVPAFGIDQTEVRRGDWAACVAAGVCDAPPEGCEVEGEPEDAETWPIACVDHAQAAAFCAWSGGRLPRFDEWEVASRGTDGLQWPWGNTPPDCLHANYRYVGSYCNTGVVAVGSYPDRASPFGLLDVAGNAWEWVQEGHDPAAETGPGAAANCGDDCPFQMIRGGAYNTTRDTVYPGGFSIAQGVTLDDNIGLRCAYDR